MEMFLQNSEKVLYFFLTNLWEPFSRPSYKLVLGGTSTTVLPCNRGISFHGTSTVEVTRTTVVPQIPRYYRTVRANK